MPKDKLYNWRKKTGRKYVLGFFNKMKNKNKKQYNPIDGWYCYRQNNSGGEFDVNDNVKHYVYIQANSASSANDKAIELGIYFDGVSDGIDCECCGDRWSMETECLSSLFKTALEDARHNVSTDKFFNKEAILYYKNGKTVTVKQ